MGHAALQLLLDVVIQDLLSTCPTPHTLSQAYRAGFLLYAVIQDLAQRAMHCCYGDSWPARLGGVAALKLLVET